MVFNKEVNGSSCRGNKTKWTKYLASHCLMNSYNTWSCWFKCWYAWKNNFRREGWILYKHFKLVRHEWLYCFFSNKYVFLFLAWSNEMVTSFGLSVWLVSTVLFMCCTLVAMEMPNHRTRWLFDAFTLIQEKIPSYRDCLLKLIIYEPNFAESALRANFKVLITLQVQPIGKAHIEDLVVVTFQSKSEVTSIL